MANRREHQAKWIKLMTYELAKAFIDQDDTPRPRRISAKQFERLMGLPPSPTIKPHSWRARQFARPKPAYDPIAAAGVVTPRRYALGYVRRGRRYPEGGPTPATAYPSTRSRRYLSSSTRQANPLRLYPPNQRGLENCNWRDAAKTGVEDAFNGAIFGATTGTAVGSAAVGTGFLPGMLSGAAMGGALGGSIGLAKYGVTCWM